MSEITLIIPEKPSDILSNMVKFTIENSDIQIINSSQNLPTLKNRKILFAVELNKAGYNIELFKIFTELYNRGNDSLSGSTGVLLIHSDCDLFTKTMAQDIIFRANQLGCSFPGKPMVELIGSMRNLLTMQKVTKKTLEETSYICSKTLGKRLISDNPKLLHDPKLLVLHASSRKTSNTLMLWDMISKHLTDYNIKEIHIENGIIKDCIGCSYKTCMHYGEQTSCFYGGFMVEEVYPAVLEADAIIWICPNYNDALSANLSAVINRLTALFRKTKFYNKSLFGIIVSGSSGSDAIAKQLISALNINKTFRLPPYFSIMATANDKNDILKVPEIEKKAMLFAENLKKEIRA